MIAENIDAMHQWQKNDSDFVGYIVLYSVIQCLKMNNEILSITLSLTHLHNVLLYTYLKKKKSKKMVGKKH